VSANAYQFTKFQFPSSVSFWDKEGVPKFNVGATMPLPLPYPICWKFYVCSKYLARSNSLPTVSIISLCIVQLCKYVFSIGFPLYVPKNVVFGGFEGEDVKILCSHPQKALPCMNMHLLVYCVSKSVQRPVKITTGLLLLIQPVATQFLKISFWRSVERFCVQRKKFLKNWVATGCMGRSNPCGDLDKMWHVGRYGGHNHVCNIRWLLVKGCGCGERGNFVLSHWL